MFNLQLYEIQFRLSRLFETQLTFDNNGVALKTKAGSIGRRRKTKAGSICKWDILIVVLLMMLLGYLLINYFRKIFNITFVGNIKTIKKSLSFFFSRKKFLKLLIFKSMSLRHLLTFLLNVNFSLQ